METFDLESILTSEGNARPEVSATSSEQTVQTVEVASSSHLPNAGDLFEFVKNPGDRSFIALFSRGKANKDKLSDMLLTEVTNYLAAGSVDIRFYILARIFCDPLDAARIATPSRTEYSSTEWFKAASIGLNSSITDSPSLMKRLKAILLTKPQVVSALAGLANKFKK